MLLSAVEKVLVIPVTADVFSVLFYSSYSIPGSTVDAFDTE